MVRPLAKAVAEQKAVGLCCPCETATGATANDEINLFLVQYERRLLAGSQAIQK